MINYFKNDKKKSNIREKGTKGGYCRGSKI